MPFVGELLKQTSLKVLSKHPLPIRIHLLGLPGSSLDEIRTAVSHPMAIKQCKETLAKLGIAPEESASTSVAAQSLSDPSKAALASDAAAEAYGLVVLKPNVHDRDVNETTFVVVSR